MNTVINNQETNTSSVFENPNEWLGSIWVTESSEAYMLFSIDGCYGMLSLKDGLRWEDMTNNIRRLLSDFTLLYREATITINAKS